MTTKNDKDQIIKKAFLAIKSIEDLVDLLNFIDNFNIKTEDKKFKLKSRHLKYFIHISKSSYTTYFIPKKKKGEKRKITAPIEGLKIILKKINYCLQLVFTPKLAAHGFVQSRSIVTNAKKHVAKKYIYNIDLENFFPSIHFGRVKAVFKLPPFNFSEKISTLLANLCCHQSRLPQGSPTSPTISNIVTQRLDNNLARLAKKYNSRYTRYADDITFSSNTNPFNNPNFQIELNKIIKQEGFKINENKTRLLSWRDRQIVTGLVVNKKLNVQKKYLQGIRFYLNLWENYGEKKAEIHFKKDYLKRKNHIKYNGIIPDMRNVLHGKLEFFKMVRGEGDKKFKKLKSQFEKLIKPEELNLIQTKDNQITANQNCLPQILNKLSFCFDNFKKEPSIQKRDSILIEMNNLFFEIKNNNLAEDENIIRLKDKFKHRINSDSKRNKNLLLFHQNRYLEKDNAFKIIRNPNSELKERISHNPRYVTFLLNKFQDPNSNLRNVVHSNVKTNFLNSIEKARKELFADFPKKGLPRDLYFHIKNSFLDILISRIKSDRNNHLNSAEGFNEYNSIITSFKKTYRFGISGEETNLKESIFRIIDKIEGFHDKFWRIEYPETNFNLETFTNTINVLNGIKIILEGFEKKTNGKGILKIEIQKIQNIVAFDLIDVGSISKKSPELLSTGGDNTILKETLFSLCDLQILTEFEGISYKVPLLSLPNANINTSENEITKPKGFTYRLIFYNVPKILLIDDDLDDRIVEQVELLKNIHPDYKKYLTDSKDIHTYDILENYNLLLLHKSFHSYEALKKLAVEKYKIKLVSFGGGIKDFETKNNQHFINDKSMYSNLGKLIQEIKDNQRIDINILKTGNKNNKNFLIESKRKIYNQIEKENLSIPKLSPAIHDILINIFKIKKNTIPKVENEKQLNEIINQQIENLS